MPPASESMFGFQAFWSFAPYEPWVDPVCGCFFDPGWGIGTVDDDGHAPGCAGSAEFCAISADEPSTNGACS